ncbi:MAG: hypothetical protein WC604_03750 [Candidatus Gracilibacteria bacterium]
MLTSPDSSRQAAPTPDSPAPAPRTPSQESHEISLSAQYSDLARYLSIVEQSRDERTNITDGTLPTVPRLKRLSNLCEEHRVTGANVPVRSIDKSHLREMQQATGDRVHLTIDSFSPELAIERAINGLITRAVKAVNTPGASTIDVEESLAQDDEALADLQKAVSARIGRNVRIEPMGTRLTDNGPSRYLWILGQ